MFVITVFGSCLDAFFGLTANGLHRYIQDPNEISETLDHDAIHNLLTKAVEIRFVGQSFIFGVTLRKCLLCIRANYHAEFVIQSYEISSLMEIQLTQQHLWAEDKKGQVLAREL